VTQINTAADSGEAMNPADEMQARLALLLT
jgi:hypothetical protein